MAAIGVYKEGSEERVLSEVANASDIMHWRRVDIITGDPDALLDVQSSKRATGLYLQSFSQSVVDFYETVGAQLGCPWLILFIVEKSIWMYRQYNGREVLHEFSCIPGFGADEATKERLREEQAGDANQLASLWGVRASQVDRYLRFIDFDSDDIGTKAYERDSASFGDYEQGYDFLRALTGVEFKERNTVMAFKTRSS